MLAARVVKPATPAITPATPAVTPATPAVIPATPTVIPAKAGIQKILPMVNVGVAKVTGYRLSPV